MTLKQCSLFVNGGKVKEHHLDRWNPSKSEAENLAMPNIHVFTMTATAIITNAETHSS